MAGNTDYPFANELYDSGAIDDLSDAIDKFAKVLKKGRKGVRADDFSVGAAEGVLTLLSKLTLQVFHENIHLFDETADKRQWHKTMNAVELATDAIRVVGQD